MIALGGIVATTGLRVEMLMCGVSQLQSLLYCALAMPAPAKK
jgi:hypothetical protein